MRLDKLLVKFSLIKTVFCLSSPLMLSSLSTFLMVFSDRIILSRHSMDAMNAVASAGMIFCCFHFGTLAITTIAEVFVGQFNGSKSYDQAGSSVWQMIWFSVFSLLIFWPVGLFLSGMLVPNEYHSLGIPYLRTLMLLGPVFPLVGALSSFFIGRKKSQFITILVVVSNLINLVLDLLFIFGVPGLIPAMGTKGAALATGVAYSFQAVVLFALFLHPHNAKSYETRSCRLVPDLFVKLIKIGWPSMVSKLLGFSAWAVLFRMLAGLQKEYFTSFIICYSVFSLFCFATEGMNKAVITLSANFIGEEKGHSITNLLSSAIVLHLLIALLAAVPMIVFPRYLIDLFIAKENEMFIYIISKNNLRWLWLFFVLEGIYRILQGILTSAGDTKFIMTTNAASIWFLTILPIYLIVILFNNTPMIIFKIMVISYSLIIFVLFIRYKISSPYFSHTLLARISRPNSGKS